MGIFSRVYRVVAFLAAAGFPALCQNTQDPGPVAQVPYYLLYDDFFFRVTWLEQVANQLVAQGKEYRLDTILDKKASGPYERGGDNPEGRRGGLAPEERRHERRRPRELHAAGAWDTSLQARQDAGKPASTECARPRRSTANRVRAGPVQVVTRRIRSPDRHGAGGRGGGPPAPKMINK